MKYRTLFSVLMVIIGAVAGFLFMGMLYAMCKGGMSVNCDVNIGWKFFGSILSGAALGLISGFIIATIARFFYDLIKNKRRPTIRKQHTFFAILVSVAICSALFMLVKPVNEIHLVIQYRLGKRDMRSSNLRYFDLSGANLPEIDLLNSDLSGSDLGGANLSHANLKWSDMTEANIQGTNLIDADLSRARLHGTKLSDETQLSAKWHMVWEIVNAGGVRRDLRGAELSMTDLRFADLRGADMSNTNLVATRFDGADLRGADLSNATLFNTSFKEADLRGANLSGTISNGGDFSKATYDNNTIWPTGTDPELKGATLLSD